MDPLIAAAVQAFTTGAASEAGKQVASGRLARFFGRPVTQRAELRTLVAERLSTEAGFRARLTEWLTSEANRDTSGSVRFLLTRASVWTDVGVLVERALEEHSSLRESHDVPLLTQPGWIPSKPIPLLPERILMRREMSPPADNWMAAKRLLRGYGYWPIVSGQTMSTLHAAIDWFEKPNWYNGDSYRLTKVEPVNDTLRLVFADEPCGYFDLIDTTQPLEFEAAWQYEKTAASIGGPYRTWLGDPFDLTRRCAIPGINTLTIRRAGTDATFFLHNRINVSTAANTRHVIPAGEFQPSGDSAPARENDFDLLRTVVREYAEEMLGVEDARGQDLAPIDYSSDRRYASLYSALTSGEASLYFLGIGLYPLTWKPEILLACVFDERAFDRLFKHMTPPGEGGYCLPRVTKARSYLFWQGRRSSYSGWPFVESTVRDFRDHSTTLPAGRAALGVAWEHRRELGL